MGKSIIRNRIGFAFMTAVAVTFMVLMIVVLALGYVPIMSEESDSSDSVVLYGIGRVDFDAEDILEYSEALRSVPFLLDSHRYYTPDDPTLLKVYGILEERMKDRDDLGKASYLAKFVQYNVHYADDLELHGALEYVQYPSETLLSGEGDCEDSSLLLYTLYRMAGLDTVLMFSLNHCFVAVAVDGEGESVEFFGKTYYTVEVTDSWKIGEYEHEGINIPYVPERRTIPTEAVMLLCACSLLFSYFRYSWDGVDQGKGTYVDPQVA